MVTLKKALCVFFAIVFICCVFTYGREEIFSAEKWIDNIVTLSDLGTIEDVLSCWTEEGRLVEVSSNGTGSAWRYEYYESYTGENEILRWLDSVVGFFKRLYDTGREISEMIIGVYQNLPLLFPWNAVVPIE